MDILTIRALQKRFGDKQVLRGIDLSVPTGSVFGFIGKNGAGKTTTMKAILGLLRVDAGEILIDGQPVRYGQSATNRIIGYLPDVPEFYPFMTAREYLSLCGESLQMPSGSIKERSEELLTLVGLAQETHRIRGYSRGMKQRLGIAQALLGSPRLLICDEPTSALDPVGRKEILDILLSVKDRTTVLFSTHVLSDVERICTDVAFLNDGRIAMQGTVSQLKALHPLQTIRLELRHPGDLLALLAAFPAAVRTEDTVLTLAGDETTMQELLHYLAQSNTPIVRVEQIEPTLESLFMEVVS